jgi:pyrimidine oxygenase
MKIGVFIPIGSRGWLISTSSPLTMPSYDLNRAIVQRAEFYGLDFALSMSSCAATTGPANIGCTIWNHSL